MKECPKPDCGYNANMKLYDDARRRKDLILQSTRSNANEDAHRDFDHFDLDEELARIHRALEEVRTTNADPQSNPQLYTFLVEAFSNIDEHKRREGASPKAWSGDGA